MTLAALIRGRPKVEASALATAIPATAATEACESRRMVARVATVAVANCPEHETVVAHRWLLRFPACVTVEVTFAPSIDPAGALACYPDAVAAEPLTETPTVAIPSDIAALFRACRQAGLYDDTDLAALPAMVALDADGTRALVADMHARIFRCSRCRHFRKPGLSSGYCTGRKDQPIVYGLLRNLPEDGGAWCESYCESALDP